MKVIISPSKTKKIQNLLGIDKHKKPMFEKEMREMGLSQND